MEITGIMSQNTVTKKIRCELYHDSKAEVESITEIEGMPVGYTLAGGSHIVTGDFHIGIFKSNGTWSWDDDEENTRSTKSLNENLKKSDPQLTDVRPITSDRFDDDIIEEKDEVVKE